MGDAWADSLLRLRNDIIGEDIRNMEKEKSRGGMRKPATNAAKTKTVMGYDANGELATLPNPIRYITAAIGRNESCPCGSGKKFKRCCSSRYTRKVEGG